MNAVTLGLLCGMPVVIAFWTCIALLSGWLPWNGSFDLNDLFEAVW